MNDRFRFRVWDKSFHKYCENVIVSTINEEITVYGRLVNGRTQLIPNSHVVLEQCTGLKDKNGRLIYEGDILEFDLSIPTNGGHHRGIVYWKNQNNLIVWMISSLKHTGSWDIRQIAHPNDWMTWAEVIGNIHENPELLEDK
jgi:phage uncharacterized protein TIGR01671